MYVCFYQTRIINTTINVALFSLENIQYNESGGVDDDDNYEKQQSWKLKMTKQKEVIIKTVQQ